MTISRTLYRRDVSFSYKQPLKYVTGNEVSESVVIDPALVTADARGIKTLAAGTLLVKATSGSSSGYYGPYSSSATDGRQTLTSRAIGDVVILTADTNFTVDNEQGLHGAQAIGAWFGYCVFNGSELTLNGATASTVAAAMLACTIQ